VSLPGRFLELDDGLRVFVHRSGPAAHPAGPDTLVPLVLLHGYLDSHWGFRSILPALAERVPVVAVDLPGFGESDRPQVFSYDVPGFAQVIHAVLDALGIRRATILGHSLGAAIALEMAARWADRVSRLVLLDAAVYPLDPPLEARLAFTPVIGPALFKRVYGRRDLRRVLRNLYFRDPRLASEEQVDYMWDRLNRPGGREAAYRTLQTIYLAPLGGERVKQVRCPALILWGDEDRAQPLASGRRLAHDLPGSLLEPIAAAGHMPHLERPREVLRRVVPFLSSGDRHSFHVDESRSTRGEAHPHR
jgi:pimeloyl-ACP methyl ester carboxylesterase